MTFDGIGHARDGDAQEPKLHATVCILDRDHFAEPGESRDHLLVYGSPRRNGCAYKAETDQEGDDVRRQYGYKWTPSIHMPRWIATPGCGR